jgi:hypothetical protein
MIPICLQSEIVEATVASREMNLDVVAGVFTCIIA